MYWTHEMVTFHTKICKPSNAYCKSASWSWFLCSPYLTRFLTCSQFLAITVQSLNNVRTLLGTSRPSWPPNTIGWCHELQHKNLVRSENVVRRLRKQLDGTCNKRGNKTLSWFLVCICPAIESSNMSSQRTFTLDWVKLVNVRKCVWTMLLSQ